MNKLFKLDGIPYIILGNILIYGLLILWITVIEPLLKGTGVQFEGFLPTGTLIRGIIAYGCMFLFDLFFAVRSNVRFSPDFSGILSEIGTVHHLVISLLIFLKEGHCYILLFIQ